MDWWIDGFMEGAEEATGLEKFFLGGLLPNVKR